MFNGESFSRAIACCGCLTSYQNVLISTIHIKNVIARLCFFFLRRKIIEKQQQVRNFAWRRQQATSGALWSPQMGKYHRGDVGFAFALILLPRFSSATCRFSARFPGMILLYYLRLKVPILLSLLALTPSRLTQI